MNDLEIYLYAVILTNNLKIIQIPILTSQLGVELQQCKDDTSTM